MKIKTANEPNRQAVINLINELQKTSHNPMVDIKTQQFEKILQDNHHKIFLIENDGLIIGLATFYSYPKISGQRAVVEDFIVTANERGKGYGTKLLEYIKQYCKDNNIGVLNIASGFEHEKAHRFYEKNGGSFKAKLFKFYL